MKLLLALLLLVPKLSLSNSLNCYDKNNCNDFEIAQFSNLVCFNVCKYLNEKNTKKDRKLEVCEISFVNAAKEGSILTNINMNEWELASSEIYDDFVKKNSNETNIELAEQCFKSNTFKFSEYLDSIDFPLY